MDIQFIENIVFGKKICFHKMKFIIHEYVVTWRLKFELDFWNNTEKHVSGKAPLWCLERCRPYKIWDGRGKGVPAKSELIVKGAIVKHLIRMGGVVKKVPKSSDVIHERPHRVNKAYSYLWMKPPIYLISTIEMRVFWLEIRCLKSATRLLNRVCVKRQG